VSDRPMPAPGARAAVARSVLDRSAYMTLGTADADGRPWVSPVWFACDAQRTFWWVSRPDAVHSRNIAARPDVAIVVFDTGAAVGEAQAVYVRARAAQVDDPDGLRVAAQEKREDPSLVDRAIAVDTARRRLSGEADALRAQRKDLSAQVGATLGSASTRSRQRRQMGVYGLS